MPYNGASSPLTLLTLESLPGYAALQHGNANSSHLYAALQHNFLVAKRHGYIVTHQSTL